MRLPAVELFLVCVGDCTPALCALLACWAVETVRLLAVELLCVCCFFNRDRALAHVRVSFFLYMLAILLLFVFLVLVLGIVIVIVLVLVLVLSLCTCFRL